MNNDRPASQPSAAPFAPAQDHSDDSFEFSCVEDLVTNPLARSLVDTLWALRDTLDREKGWKLLWKLAVDGVRERDLEIERLRRQKGKLRDEVRDARLGKGVARERQ